jgi:hypothetical protein
MNAASSPFRQNGNFASQRPIAWPLDRSPRHQHSTIRATNPRFTKAMGPTGPDHPSGDQRCGLRGEFGRRRAARADAADTCRWARREEHWQLGGSRRPALGYSEYSRQFSLGLGLPPAGTKNPAWSFCSSQLFCAQGATTKLGATTRHDGDHPVDLAAHNRGGNSSFGIRWSWNGFPLCDGGGHHARIGAGHRTGPGCNGYGAFCRHHNGHSRFNEHCDERQGAARRV